MKRIIIIGAGPGGIAAAEQLRAQAGGQVEIILIERGGTAEFLPGTLATALGQTTASQWQQPVSLQGIKVKAGEVSQANGEGVVLDGETVTADFVIAAPGLALDNTAVPSAPNIFPLWSPSSAEKASAAVQAQQGSRIAVIVAGMPYRCPPAPFSLAMQLAAGYQAQQRNVQVFVTTPEERPLIKIGNGIPEHLEQSCAKLGVQLHTQFKPDWSASSGSEIVSADGRSEPFDLALVVPPHVRAPMLHHLPEDGPLVAVSPQFESDEKNLFVIGDAAKTPFPRAAGAATAQGKTAADVILARLGIIESAALHAPEPECYIGHGNNIFSKISIRYPNGLPPAAKPVVTLEAASAALVNGFTTAFEVWKGQRHEG